MASLYKRYKMVVDPAMGEKNQEGNVQMGGRYTDARGTLHRVPLSSDKNIYTHVDQEERLNAINALPKVPGADSKNA